MNQNDPSVNPSNSSAEEQDSITGYVDELRQIEIEGYELGVRKARNALFWTAGLLLVGELINLFMNPPADSVESWIVFPIILVEVGVFVGLGFYTKKKPYTAVVLGLIAFILVLLMAAVSGALENGAAGMAKALVSGIIIKVLILVNLIRPLKDAKALQQAREMAAG